MPIPLDKTWVDQIITALGLNHPRAIQRANVEAAARFYAQDMALTDPIKIASHMQGIDLHWPVTRADLLPGTNVVAFRYNPQLRFDRLDPFGEYFTDVGSSKYDLGIGPDERRFIRYEVRSRVTALRSRTKTGFVPGFGVVRGGSIQYVIPRASAHLRVMHIQHAIK